MALDGFFPKDAYGIPTQHFTDFSKVLPILTFILSFFASAFGISKFFLVGPLRLISKEAPLSGMLSLTFVANLVINTGFVFRMYAIEHTFFSAYRNYTLEYSYEKFGAITSSIDPILLHKFRLLAYFIPIIPSMMLNALSLRSSMNTKLLLKLFLVFPQYFINSCFNPLMFEGITIHDQLTRTSHFKIKVWKLGTILNTVYLICIPQIILIVSDVLRGIPDWTFTRTNSGLAAESTGFLEANSSILKHPFGNITMSIIVCVICLGGLTFLVLKGQRVFAQESDILAVRFDDTTEWKILWIREQSSTQLGRHDLQV
jgi:hypothetical protein